MTEFHYLKILRELKNSKVRIFFDFFYLKLKVFEFKISFSHN